MGETQTEKSPTPSPPRATRWAAAFKAWSEAASASIKALLLAGALWLSVFAAGRVMWIEETTHPLRVDVGQDAQAAINTHGGDLDLRFALEDALNERIQAVRQVFQVQGLTVVGADAPTQSVSFKPFGVEVSTDEITKLTELIVNRPPAPTLRLELMCAPHACSDAASHPDRLVMTLVQAGGLHRAAYPLAPGPAALRRSLRQVVQNVADTVLEQSEPNIASVWFLNHGKMAAVASDQSDLDLSRAVGAAVAARGLNRRDACFADLVIGASLIERAESDQGIAAEQRALESSNAVCRVQAATNIVNGLFDAAFCDTHSDVRALAHPQIDRVLGQLASIRPHDVPDVLYLRIPAARLLVQVGDLMASAGPDTQTAFCSNSSRPDHGPAGQVANRIIGMIDQIQQALPTDASGEALHGIIASLYRAIRHSIPRDDLQGRIDAASRMLNMIYRYETTDPSPRSLYIAEAGLAKEMVFAVVDGMNAPAPILSRLAKQLGGRHSESDQTISDQMAIQLGRYSNEAQIAYDNARAAVGVALTDPTDADVLGWLGDATMLGGNDGGASLAYRQAVESFAEANEPTEQVPAIADTLARWASLLIMKSGCEPKLRMDANWSAVWARLGFAPPDICAMTQDGAPPPEAQAETPILVRLVEFELGQCKPAGPIKVVTDWVPETAARAALVVCHQDQAANFLGSVEGVQGSSAQLDTELMQALETRR